MAEQDIFGNVSIDILTSESGSPVTYKERTYASDGTVSSVQTVRDNMIEAIRKSLLTDEEKHKFIETVNKEFGDPNQPPDDHFHLGGTAAPGADFAGYSMQIGMSGYSGAAGGAVTPQGVIMFGAANPGSANQVIVKGSSNNNNQDPNDKGFWQGLWDRWFRKKVSIPLDRLQHVIDRHTVLGDANKGKSIFNACENIINLIKKSSGVQAELQFNGNYKRTVSMSRNIGFDRNTGQQTNKYTVITKPDGTLVTAFPGESET